MNVDVKFISDVMQYSIESAIYTPPMLTLFTDGRKQQFILDCMTTDLKEWACRNNCEVKTTALPFEGGIIYKACVCPERHDNHRGYGNSEFEAVYRACYKYWSA